MFESFPNNQDSGNEVEDLKESQAETREEQYNAEQFEADSAEAGMDMIDTAQEAESRISKLINKFGETKALQALKKKTGLLKGAGITALLALTLSTQDASAQENPANYIAQNVPSSSSNQIEQVDESMLSYQQHITDRFSQEMNQNEQAAFSALQRLEMSIQKDIKQAAESVYPEKKDEREGVYVSPQPFAQAVTVGYESPDGSLNVNVQIDRETPEFNLTYNF